MIIGLRKRVVTASGVVAAMLLGTLSVTAAVAPSVSAAQPIPGHTQLVPQVPRNNTPRISNGEIWDIEVVGNRVFIAGSFTTIADVAGTTTPLAQASLAAYDINTGKIDRTFRPTFGGGGVTAVEASPDGTALYVAGSFNTINGVTKRKIARLNPATGAPVTTFTANAGARAGALAVGVSSVYVGGQFTTVNGVARVGLVALNPTTGVVDAAFNNQISGGIGVNGALTVQQLKLTHDESKLLVVHTGRKIAGQDRLGIALIDTATKTLLPWRTRLWDDNLARVGGVQRIYGADIAPNDQYFVVTSGSGGDAPPISDTAVRFPIAGGDFTDPTWVARCFDSVYSVAITEQAVYIGGHFSWNESPTAEQPWPGLTNVGYGTGQGLSGYGLGDQVVRRDHLGALDPATGTAVEWDPASDSFEGNKAMEATSRGLFVGGDGTYQGGVQTGRVAFYDLNTIPPATTTDTTITAPIQGRVVPAGEPFTITGLATNPVGIRRVQVEIIDRNSNRYLQDDLVTWGTTANNIYATLGAGTTSRTWSLPMTIAGNRQLRLTAKTYGTNNVNDATKALKKIEVFNFADQSPSTGTTGPSGIQTSTSFTFTGTATDPVNPVGSIAAGINSIIYSFRDENNQYLQNDGSVSAIYNTFRGSPDVVGAPNATWSYPVVLPHEGSWTASATAVDTAGQADLRSADRSITINSTALAPKVTIAQPVAMTPPGQVAPLVRTPGNPLTFSGTATDENRVTFVSITFRNTTTRENLASDGTWGVDKAAGVFVISPANLSVASYNWSWTTPFNLSPGTYQFTVRATDNDEISTASSDRGNLTINVQVPGDGPPKALVSTPVGTIVATSPDITLTGTASDDLGVAGVRVVVFDNDSGRYLQPNGTLTSGYVTLPATVTPVLGSSTNVTWSLPIHLPSSGDFSVTAYAVDTAGQQDTSTTGATARYRYYPNDLAPVLNVGLASPVSNAIFTQGRIVVTGRADDDFSMARVEIGIVDSLNRYLSSTGTFTSTTPSWRTAYLNSPGSPGSNFSYTTPVIPDGAYSVLVRATDQHGQVSDPPMTSTGVTVSHPANNAPVANATFSCVANVCTFDGRTSTDENATALTYGWDFGNGTGSGPKPVRTYTAPGPVAGAYSVKLTVTDEWGLQSTFTLTVPMVEPPGNVAPTIPVAGNFLSCIALVCSVSGSGTVDPNVGDVITYTWVWGDGFTSTGATSTHTYAAPGTYPATMTATDGWGRSATKPQTVVLVEGSNVAPVASFNVTCLGLTCTLYNTSTDGNGDVMHYVWDFGTTPATGSTVTAPQKVYPAAGTYTITLTAIDGWNRSSTPVTKSVTVAP